MQSKQDMLRDGINWPQPNQVPPFWERDARASPMPLARTVSSSAQEKDADTMQIIHITAEMAPIAKVSGERFALLVFCVCQ
jgi:starch synthase